MKLLSMGLLLGAAVLCEAHCGRELFARSAQDFLSQEKGLVQQQHRWLLPLELQMQGRVRSLPKLESRLQTAHNQSRSAAEALQAANANVQTQIARREGLLKSLQESRQAQRSPGRRKLIDAQMATHRARLADLRKAHIEPALRGGVPVLRGALIELTNRRNALAMTLLWIQESRPKLSSQYEELAADQATTAALAELGEGHALGSGEDYESRRFLLRLSQYERLVFDDALPLYREGDDLRLAALVGHTPVTFTWKTSAEPTLLTASVIEAAGLRVPADAPTMKQRTSDGRDITVRQFEIPYLRFGRHVLRNVPALALPPEGENIGTQIGAAGLTGLSPMAEPEKFRLVLR